ncbi:MAG: DUF2605 domain-containing protein [Cyanobacteria bacterium J06635_10]
MRDSNNPDPELLKTVLGPLLEDFEYWFTRSRTFLETEQLSFLSDREQSDLLRRVKLAADEVKTAKMLFTVAEGKVGVDMATLMPWHQLVTECWSVAMRFRSKQDVSREQDKLSN